MADRPLTIAVRTKVKPKPVAEAPKPAVDKSDRTKQVQFRMNPDKLKELKKAIALDDSLDSMADLFNRAAEEYLKNR